MNIFILLIKIITIANFLISSIHSLEWFGNFANFPDKWNISKSYLIENRQTVPDPKGSTDICLKVKYPNGTYSSAGVKGGTGFIINPFGTLTNIEQATLEYDVLFPANFDFVKGGKLPGFYGGRTNCSGGDQALDCFSTRLMFGSNETGYGYLYVSKIANHTKEFCDLVTAKNCAPDYGYSIGASKYFLRDRWVKVKELVKLNTIGQQNGIFIIWIDGVIRFEFYKMVFRTSNVNISGIAFETFFGGNTIDWATRKDEVAYFKNLRVQTF